MREQFYADHYCSTRTLPAKEPGDRRFRVGRCLRCWQLAQAIGDYELHGTRATRCQFFRGDDYVSLQPGQAAIIWAIIVRGYGIFPMKEMIEVIYPDPFTSPENEIGTMKTRMCLMNSKISDLGLHIKSRGHYLELVRRSPPSIL
jgi:hypothetical protein